MARGEDQQFPPCCSSIIVNLTVTVTYACWATLTVTMIFAATVTVTVTVTLTVTETVMVTVTLTAANSRPSWFLAGNVCCI